MENEKLNDYISDMTKQGCFSNCCSADIIMGDICARCKEHCEPSEDEE